MYAFVLYSLSPLVGLLPFSRIINKKALLIFSVLFFSLSIILWSPLVFSDYSYTNRTIDRVVKTCIGVSLGLLLNQIVNSHHRLQITLGMVVAFLIFSGIFVLLEGFGSLLNTKSPTNIEWTSYKYAITKHSEHGYAGPPIQKYTLYEFKLGKIFNREIASTTDIDDKNCTIVFENYSNSQTLTFDRCKLLLK